MASPTPSAQPATDWNTLSLSDYAARVLASGHVQRLLDLCVEEDLGTTGDVTSLVCVPEADSAARVTARLRSRQPARAAGLAFVPLICAAFSKGSCAWRSAVTDGASVEPGDLLGELSGPRGAVLGIERTMLNLVSRLSGIATLTDAYAEAIRAAGADPHRVRLLDTRKTTPGHRLIEKYAVRCGGGYSHRIGLYDAVLVKDNHIAMATGGLEGILSELKTARDRFTLQFVEVEVDSLEQFETILAAEQASPGLVDIVLLDNMPPDTLREAVARRDRAGSRIRLEASGGITLETIGAVALTGVDRISTGAITHQARSVDFGLDAG
ncbi:MAG: carboxylating nicotinate-nucleotide diphosphorylase [bacterium]|nr:carboxylating nicotinate-nucleotide diphosphorylase [bacterium]